jgi:hypothetical protein
VSAEVTGTQTMQTYPDQIPARIPISGGHADDEFQIHNSGFLRLLVWMWVGPRREPAAVGGVIRG